MGQKKASLLEENTPWEVKLLQDYCKTVADLDTVSTTRTSGSQSKHYIIIRTSSIQYNLQISIGVGLQLELGQCNARVPGQ